MFLERLIGSEWQKIEEAEAISCHREEGCGLFPKSVLREERLRSLGVAVKVHGIPGFLCEDLQFMIGVNLPIGALFGL